MAKKEPVEERNLDGYGSPPIPWTRALERFEQDKGISPHWLATVRPDGRPHVMPIWAVWVDGKFCFVTGSRARKRKNLSQNAHCVIAVASSGLDLVVEGKAVRVSDPTRLQRIADVYTSQGWHTTVQNGVVSSDFGAPSAGPPPYEVYEVVAETVFALGREEPYGATRWQF